MPQDRTTMAPQNASPPKNHDEPMKTPITTIIAIAFLVALFLRESYEKTIER